MVEGISQTFLVKVRDRRVKVSTWYFPGYLFKRYVPKTLIALKWLPFRWDLLERRGIPVEKQS